MDEFKLSSEQFELLSVIGSGGFGTVMSCLKKDTEEIMAAKICYKDECASQEVGHFVDLDVYLIDCMIRSTVSRTYYLVDYIL